MSVLSHPDSTPRPRRACLSVPGNSQRMLAKACQLSVDEVVLDLEDAVPASEKERALTTVVEALQTWTGSRPSVRVNAPRTRWCHIELIQLAAVACRPLTIVVPKVESAADITFVDRLLDGAELASGASATIGLVALIETPAGLAAASEIAGACARLEGLILGYADLAAALGRASSATANLDLWLPAQETLLTAARPNDVQAIDGPFLGVADDQPFRAAASRAQQLGFDGKWAIHPAQLPTLMQLFTPSTEELAHARAVLAALNHAEASSGAGAVTLDGQMLDEALRRAAMRTLTRSGEVR